MKHIKIWFTLLLLICGIGTFAFFYQAYPYHLQHREQMLLFTYTWEQLTSYFSHPAALACLLGDFLTQFFHLTIVGPLIVALALAKLQLMAFLTFRKWLNGWIAMILATGIFVWEGLRFCDIIYPLAGTVSLIAGFFLFLCVSTLKRHWSFLTASFVTIFIGYYLFGYGVFIFAACVAIESIARSKRSTITTLEDTSKAETIHEGSEKLCHRIQHTTAVSVGSIILPIVAILLPAASASHFLMMPGDAYTYPATVWKGKPNYSDERILGLSTEYYHDNWNKIIELAYQGTASNDVSICYNLANAMQGHLADRLMYYYQPGGFALFMPVFEESTYLSTQLAGEIWYRLGDMTMAEHASILSMIFSPDNKSSRMVKRLAEINLINGETEAAEKYLNILSKTLFYSDWAREHMPGKESETVKTWLKEKRKFVPKKDALRLSSTDVINSLHTLLDSNPDNKIACDYLLCFHLLMKDLDNFITDYQVYYKGKPNRLYSEALMIHLFQKRAKASEVKATGIHPSVIKDFNHYNQVYNQSHGSESALENQFARTYWFFFQFAKFDKIVY